MNVTQALQNIADDLYEIQEFDITTNTTFLGRKMLRACQYIKGLRQWSFLFKTGTISVSDTDIIDNRGPYDLPSDFGQLGRDERLSWAWTWDGQSVPIIKDGDTGIIYRAFISRAENKLYFTDSIPAGDYTLYYISNITSLDDVADWPEDIIDCVELITKYYALNDHKDTMDVADVYYARGLKRINEYWDEQRIGQTIQETRDVRAPDGYSISEHLDLQANINTQGRDY